jgi:hypothetical protein
MQTWNSQGRSNPKLQHDGMMVAGAINGRAVHNLTGDDLDRVIGQDVIDADAGALVDIDEVGWNASG